SRPTPSTPTASRCSTTCSPTTGARASSPRTTRSASTGWRPSGSRSRDLRRPRPRARAQGPPPRAAGAGDAAREAPLPRPGASALAIFHFALPAGTSHDAALGLLWVALVFTALLGLTRAFVPEREQGLFDALVLAPCDRSAIWLGKAIAVLAFLVAAEIVALP